MKYLNNNVFFAKVLLIWFVALFASCQEHMHEESDFDYHVHIHSPMQDQVFQLGASMPLEIDFESHSNKTIHHISIKIIHKGMVIYQKPSDAHVHKEGSYTFEDNVVLSLLNGFKAGETYTLEGAVWGHDEDGEKEISMVTFKVQ